MVKPSLRAKMSEAFRLRIYFFITSVSLVFLIILIQLVNLQLIKGEEYKAKSRMNMENCIPIPAPRGEIYDRNYKVGAKNVVLASNRPSFNITVIPAKFKQDAVLRKTLRILCRMLGLSWEAVYKEIRSKSPWERVVIKEDVDFDIIVKIASHQDKFRGINWEDTTIRVYNYGNIMSHVIGYTGSINKSEYKQLKNTGYKYYHKIGKSGLEKEYDSILKGTDGYIRRIVDVRNRIEGEEVGLQPVGGHNLILTIDYEVQKAAIDAIEDKAGAIIVMKAATGELLSFVSKPDYNPNLVISANNTKIIEELTTSKERPFLNRAIQSRYPPASTFKLMTAIASLEEEKWDPKKMVYCPGVYTLKGYIDKDFFDYDTHGTCNLENAIGKSCCVYFYQVGLRIGPSTIMRYAHYFGLSQKTSIDLNGEIAGFIPSKKWKLRNFGQPWYDGDTLNLAIGQGFLNVTPIGMANFIAGIVNNGIMYRPHLVKEIRTRDNRLVKVVKPEKIREIPLSSKTLETVKAGMRQVVTSGTGGRLAGLKAQIAGKTGTAQTRSVRLEKYSQHGWFVGYAPFDGNTEKSIVVAVLVEYGVAGAATAVPIAEKIFAKLISLGYF